MPKQKMKVIQAGNFVRVVLYTPTYPSDNNKARSERQKITTEARRRINLRYSWQRLQLLIESNFRHGDIFVTLTYDDAHLPVNRKDARNKIKQFIRELRAYKKQRGIDIKYIYCIEGLHSNGRIHHHILLNLPVDDLKLLSKLWKYGDEHDVNIEPFEQWGGKTLAQYLTKEPRNGDVAECGARSWAGSKNLAKPIIYPTQWVDANIRLDTPINAHIVLNDTLQNEWGGYSYLEYYLQDPPPQTKSRSAKTKKRIETYNFGPDAIYNK